MLLCKGSDESGVSNCNLLALDILNLKVRAIQYVINELMCSGVFVLIIAINVSVANILKLRTFPKHVQILDFK